MIYGECDNWSKSFTKCHGGGKKKSKALVSSCTDSWQFVRVLMERSSASRPHHLFLTCLRSLSVKTASSSEGDVMRSQRLKKICSQQSPSDAVANLVTVMTPKAASFGHLKKKKKCSIEKQPSTWYKKDRLSSGIQTWNLLALSQMSLLLFEEFYSYTQFSL